VRSAGRALGARLVGVDLSAGMLAQARSKGVYDELVKAELTAFLRTSRRAMGRHRLRRHAVLLRRPVGRDAAAAGALRPGGVMVYTVEALADDRPAGAANPAQRPLRPWPGPPRPGGKAAAGLVSWCTRGAKCCARKAGAPSRLADGRAPPR
jgi:hypothetical protein